MIKLVNNIYIKTVAICIATVFFSCKDNYEDVKRMHKVSIEPASVAEQINLKYTDSGIVQVHLMGKKMLDYSNKEFSYTTFPEGVTVHFFHEDATKTILKSDHAVIYDQTELIDLRGNVKITMNDGKILEAAQLYWDRRNKWLFTNEPYKYIGEDGGYNIGQGGFDANEDFTIFSSLYNDGEQYIDN